MTDSTLCTITEVCLMKYVLLSHLGKTFYNNVSIDITNVLMNAHVTSP